MLKITLLVTVLLPALFCQGCVGRLFYYPDHTTYQTPAKYQLPCQEVTFASEDGTKLSGWFIPALGAAKGTVIHYHGNAQNMTAHFSYVHWLPAEGFNLFVFDYRGYGKSEGGPDRQGVYQDSIAAASYVSGRKDVDPDKLLILGQSLGGTNAIAAVGSGKLKGIRAVAIESAFASYRGIVREKIGLIPLLSLLKWPLSYLLIGDSYNAVDVVDRISPIPLLLLYESHDPVVPMSQGEELYAKARPPKTFWKVPSNMHAAAFGPQQSPYRKQLVQFYLDALRSSH